MISIKNIKDNPVSMMIAVESVLLLALIMAIIICKFDFLAFFPNCFFRDNFGVICPFCGGTRCVSNFLTFDFLNSFKFHPTTFIYIFVLMIINFMYIINTILHKSNNRLFRVLEISFYAYVGLSIIQYLIRIFLIANHIEDSFMTIELF